VQIFLDYQQWHYYEFGIVNSCSNVLLGVHTITGDQARAPRSDPLRLQPTAAQRMH
jgi:hypothetical protein